jgi:hypothetical protein
MERAYHSKCTNVREGRHTLGIQEEEEEEEEDF